MIEIKITTFLKGNKNITIPENCTIREFRQAISNAYDGLPWNMQTIFIFKRRIGLETSGDEKFMDFLGLETSEVSEQDDNSTAMKVFWKALVMFYAPHNTPSYHNPVGITIDQFKDYCVKQPIPNGYIETQEQLQFMREAAGLIPSIPYSQRLRAINMDIRKVPRKFIHPNSGWVMDNPVIGSDERSYDSSRLNAQNYKSPVDGKHVHVISSNLLLRSELELFVAKKELEYAQENQPAQSAVSDGLRNRHSSNRT